MNEKSEHECVVAVECDGWYYDHKTWPEIDQYIMAQEDVYDSVEEDDYAMLDLCPLCGRKLDAVKNRHVLTNKLKVFK